MSKAFTIINGYIGGPQIGIQASHSMMELMGRTLTPPSEDARPEGLTLGQRLSIADWFNNHKTYVWLNGGDSTSMHNLRRAVHDSGYPSGLFYEEGMEGMLSSMSVIVDTESVALCDRLREVHKYKAVLNDKGTEYAIVVGDPSELEFASVQACKWPLLEFIVNARTVKL